MTAVIVLRPEPAATETLEAARKRGLEATSVPLFRLETIDWEVPEASGFDALLLTSANAVRMAGDRLRELRGLPVHAVGKATAEAAREAGFDIRSSGESGVERLLGSLEAELRLVHLCGEDRTEADNARQKITAVPVYRARAVEPAPSLDAASAAVVLVHSARAGKQFAELADAQGLERGRILLAGISASAVRSAGDGWKQVESADQPTDEALLSLAGRLCDKPPQR